MGNFKDLTNERFGMLTVKENANDPYVNPSSGRHVQRWLCKCECGKACIVLSTQLKAGKRVNCGCVDPRTKHGMATTSEYKNHNAMKSRCNNPMNTRYSDYGGRGIKYDAKWETFEGFWEDMGDSYSPGLELDRIDVNGDYCKENCRWANKSLQSFNRRIDAKNTSGKSGVSFAKNVGKWYAYIDFEGKRISLKLHDTYDAAVNARLEAELKYFGETKE